MRQRFDWLAGIDSRLYHGIHVRYRLPFLDPFMIAVTESGTKGTIWLIIAGVLVFLPDHHAREAAVAGVAALLVAEGSINWVLKPMIRRRRPYEHRGRSRLLVNAPGPNSWPSAHAGSSAAAATALGIILSPVALPLAILAVWIAYSRVYVGVHYPADVLAGLVVGLISGVVLANVAQLISGVHL